jgi:hypothetical protein
MKDKKPPGAGWAPGLVMQGKVYHRMGGLAPDENEDPHFNQIFLYDPTDGERTASEIRLGFMKLAPNTSMHKRQVLKNLLEFLHDRLIQCNRYVRDFRTVYESALQMEMDGLNIQHGHFRINADGIQARPNGEHERRYNLAEGCREIQILIPDDGGPPPPRDVIIRPRAGNLQHEINETHRSYDPLHYTLFFPEGHEDGWNLSMKLQESPQIYVDDLNDDDGDNDPSQRYRAFYMECNVRGTGQLSCRDYYAFYLHVREPSRHHRDTLLRGARAFQEYCCMAYAKIESQRLRYFWIHTHSYLHFKLSKNNKT